MTRYVRQDVAGNDVTIVEEQGVILPAGFVDRMECDSFKTQLEAARDMAIRNDDVMIAAYPKSGMHWLWEIVSMILHKRAEYDKNAKEVAMLDFKSPETIEKLQSPRILNMHFPVRWLPKQLLEKRRPILHIMRNPKDLFVSYYHHYNSIPAYNSTASFSTYLPMMTGEHGFYIQTPWYQYELEWEEFTKKNPDYPIFNIYYEDMKKDPKTWIKKVSSFLNVDVTEEMIHEIAEKTDIAAMQMAMPTAKEDGPMFLVDGKPLMYRKGMIGDWKNHFTMAENEKMDKWLAEHLVNTDLTFQYT